MTRVLVVANQRTPESAAVRRARAFQQLLRPAYELELRSGLEPPTVADIRAADLVYVMSPGRVGFPAVVRSWIARRPVIVEMPDPQAPLYRSQGRSAPSIFVGAAIDGIVGRYASAVVALGPGLPDAVKIRVPWALIPDGVDLDQYRPLDGDGLREQLGIPADTLVVGVVGSLYEGRRCELIYGWDIVDALALLRAQPVWGLVVGDGSGAATLRRHAEQLGVGDRVVMTGAVSPSEAPRYLAAIDVCVSRQTNDALGRSRTTGKLPEYLACDRFVLATRVGGAADVLPDEMLLPYEGSYDPAHPQRLAERLRHLIPRRAELRRGAGTRRIATERYAYPILADRLRGLLEKVAA
jgi:glycosyltransferase involved in cell wall biosynthesis